MLGISALLTPSACGGTPIDWDCAAATGLSTSSLPEVPPRDRPTPDARGVISYPGYQVAVAQRGDTVASVAARIGVNAERIGALQCAETR